MGSARNGIIVQLRTKERVRCVIPESGPHDEVRAIAVGSLRGVDRLFWAGLVRRNLGVSDSKLIKSLPKYGPRGATLGFVGTLWVGLGAFPAFAAEILSLTGNPSIANVFWLLSGLLCLMALSHVASAMREGRHYRSNAPTRT
jgi:hypothetical protein